MWVAASSSSSSLKKYDVFLSFRGEDTRRGFTSHLHTALCQAGIETYIDYQLPKGDDISNALIEAIEDSTIAVVVFSKTYASSKWCLKELTKILECREVQKQHVIPIFYEVDPSDVRNQKGTYQEAFEKHERDFKHDPETVNKWKLALSKTANLAGWDSQSPTCRDEAQLIQNIISNILQNLNHQSSSALKDVVGIHENCDSIEMFLEKFSVIGIWGMGGIGKTTIAKVLYAKFKSQFDSSCFLENLREESEKRGLIYVRDKLVCKLLKDSSPERLNRKKVLVVLDDISSTTQIEFLRNEAPALGPSSKVIITSRDRHVLKYGGVETIYEALGLSYDNSLKLFILKAFRKDGYKSEYKELADRAIAYARGNPLALTTLGSFLHSKTIEEWESALKKLEKMTHQDIQAVLKLSYDGLDVEEKEVFLDIACFFKGENKGSVIATLEICGFEAIICLRVLEDKALISIDHHEVQMHDLIQSMGWEIVHQECIEAPGRRSRLWIPDEIYDVLKYNQGTDAVKGIILNLCQIRNIQLSADVFKKMTNLRFLKFYSNETSYTMNFPSGLESIPNSLIYLRWDNFPLEFLPSSFCAEKLVELHMPDSQLTKLWDGVQNLVNLKEINLAGSKQLIELPDFSKARNLKKVYLLTCESLCHIHSSILSLPQLSRLLLGGCKNLKSLKSESLSKSLECIYAWKCYNLKEISLSYQKMHNLSLHQTRVEKLCSSIGRTEQLQDLSLNIPTPGNEVECSLVEDEILPCLTPHSSIGYHGILTSLYLYGCQQLYELPESIASLSSIESLNLEGTAIKSLPATIKHLSKLKLIYLSNCRRLHSLPELPPMLNYINLSNCTRLRSLPKLPSLTESVYAENCTSLETVPWSITSTPKLKCLNLENCLKLEKQSLSHIMECAYFSLNRSVYTNQIIGSIRYPGRKVPDWFKYNQATKASNFVTIELPSTTNNLVGFIFYSVLSSFNFKPVQDGSCEHSLQCKVYFEHIKDSCCRYYHLIKEFSYKVAGPVDYHIEFSPYHVLLWSTTTDGKFPTKMDDEDSNSKPKFSFEFSVVTKKYVRSNNFVEEKTEHDGLIEACGVRPIYASEYHNFLQQMELESKLGTQKKSCDDVDEHSFRGIIEYANISLNGAKFGNFETSIIPEWFTHKISSKNQFGHMCVSVELAPEFDSLLGFIFCFVIPQFSSKERNRIHSSCTCSGAAYAKGQRGWHYSMIELNSDNVFLWYDPLYCDVILQKLQEEKELGRKEGNDEETRDHNIELNFDFQFGDCWIKECGVRPIYASEYTNFLQQKRLSVQSLELSTRKKRRRNIDEEQKQLPSSKKWKESSILQPIPLISESTTSQNFDELLFTLSQLNLESMKDDHPKK